MTARKSIKEKGTNPRLTRGSQAIVPTSLTRAERKAIIDEDAEYALEEIWGYEPEDAFYKVFKRESKTGGVEDILALSKKDILDLSYRDDSTGATIHLSVADAVQVKMLRFCANYLQEQGLFPDDGSFRCTSISYQDCQIFAQDPDNINRVRQDEIEEPDAELSEFEDTNFLSNAHPLEDNLTSNIDENSVENMTTIEFEDNLSCINEEDSVESLTPQAKDVWCALPDDLKAVLVKSRNSDQGSNSDNNNYSNPSYKPAQPPSYARKPPTQ